MTTGRVLAIIDERISYIERRMPYVEDTHKAKANEKAILEFRFLKAKIKEGLKNGLV